MYRLTMGDIELDYLKAQWEPAWRIWRGRRPGDTGDERTGDWYASRMDDSAGVWPTIGRATPFLLHDALEAQRAAVEEGAQPLDVGSALRVGE